MSSCKKNCAVVALCVTGTLLVLHVVRDSASEERDLWWLLAGPPAADDPRLLAALEKHYLDPPSSLPYNFTHEAFLRFGSNGFSWPWIHSWLRTLFADQRSGFFVEAGALNGEYLSNTLWLERDLGWSGLLVEADASSYKDLRLKHRKAWSSNTCLSSEPFPKRVVFVSRYPLDSKFSVLEFSRWAYRGHSHELRADISQEHFDAKDHKSYSLAQCFPLLSYLKVLNVTQVDLLSLDTQGSEADILRSFLRSDGVKVRVIVAENEFNNFGADMMKLMQDSGYLLLASEFDFVFVRRDDPVWQRDALRSVLEGKRGNIQGYKIPIESVPKGNNLSSSD